MIRPAARDALHRYAGIWGPGLIVALGLWWVFMSGGLLRWCGYVLIPAGMGLAWAGWQRLRFGTGAGTGADGPGVVRVDEGRIAYFGPLTGGGVARSEMSALALDHTGRPAHWVLSQPGQPDLYIPVTASGAESLFDVFAGLSGMHIERMLQELEDSTPRRVELWRYGAARLR